MFAGYRRPREHMRAHQPVSHHRVVMERLLSTQIRKQVVSDKPGPFQLFCENHSTFAPFKPIYPVSVFVCVLSYQFSACIQHIHCRICVLMCALQIQQAI